MSGGLGTLAVTVWPVYVGFGTHPAEDLPVEKRSQIRWGDEAGVTVGHADVAVDGGEYPCLLYFHAPAGPPTFSATFSHPYRTPAGRTHVGPIFFVGDEITAEIP